MKFLELIEGAVVWVAVKSACVLVWIYIRIEYIIEKREFKKGRT